MLLMLSGVACGVRVVKRRSVKEESLQESEPVKEESLQESEAEVSSNVCWLCITPFLEPANKSMVINMLYLGPDSCINYFRGGSRGQIPSHLCPALQYFAAEPCNCAGGTIPVPTPAPVVGQYILWRGPSR